MSMMKVFPKGINRDGISVLCQVNMREIILNLPTLPHAMDYFPECSQFVKSLSTY